MARKVPGKKAAAGSIAEKEREQTPVAVTTGSAEPKETDVVTRTGKPEMRGGEFRGDFTRTTFDPPKHYSGVLMQQGRVQLDADWNEQADIVHHYLRALARDIIGPFGGPDDSGFAIVVGEEKPDPAIGRGHYYVDGILCENDHDGITYSGQHDYPLPMKEAEEEMAGLMKRAAFLVFLDVWERHVTMIQDQKIREIALNGPDTATRSQLVWQVRLLYDGELEKFVSTVINDAAVRDPCTRICSHVRENWNRFGFNRSTLPQLRVKAREPDDTSSVCIIRPGSRYRGPENQLYRVEIHAGGTACPSPSDNTTKCATFKWSRDNSSTDFPISSLEGTTATLAHLGRDDQSTLTEGDWVEVLGDYHVLRQKPGDLVRIESVDRTDLTVTFSLGLLSGPEKNYSLMRRWDHREDLLKKGTHLINGAIPVEEGTTNADWIDLEDGVQVQFQPAHTYKTGDYWLIPARTVSGDVGWPWDKTGRQPRPPYGIAHHYAPLAVVYKKDRGFRPCDCRCIFNPLCGTAASKRIRER